MTKEISDKLGDIECAARKLEAIGAFICETRSDDFDDTEFWFNAICEVSGTIVNESATIQKLVEEMLNED